MAASKKPSKKPNWLPDWMDQTKYPDDQKASPREWAWEFLRRNAKYQQLWRELAKLPTPLGFIHKGGSNVQKRFEIKERFEKEFGVAQPASPSMTSTDSNFKWRLRFVPQPQYWIRPRDWPTYYDFDMSDADLKHPAELLVKFDLRLKIKPQLARAQKILKTEAKKLGEPRAKFKKYQVYLRVLDAKLSGAPVNTIAAEILGIKKESHQDPQYLKNKVRDILKSAKRLSDRGYRFLAALEATK